MFLEGIVVHDFAHPHPTRLVWNNAVSAAANAGFMPIRYDHFVVHCSYAVLLHTTFSVVLGFCLAFLYVPRTCIRHRLWKSELWDLILMFFFQGTFGWDWCLLHGCSRCLAFGFPLGHLISCAAPVKISCTGWSPACHAARISELLLSKAMGKDDAHVTRVLLPRRCRRRRCRCCCCLCCLVLFLCYPDWGGRRFSPAALWCAGCPRLCTSRATPLITMHRISLPVTFMSLFPSCCSVLLSLDSLLSAAFLPTILLRACLLWSPFCLCALSAMRRVAFCCILWSCCVALHCVHCMALRGMARLLLLVCLHDGFVQSVFLWLFCAFAFPYTSACVAIAELAWFGCACKTSHFESVHAFDWKPNLGLQSSSLRLQKSLPNQLATLFHIMKFWRWQRASRTMWKTVWQKFPRHRGSHLQGACQLLQTLYANCCKPSTCFPLPWQWWLATWTEVMEGEVRWGTPAKLRASCPTFECCFGGRKVVQQA